MPHGICEPKERVEKSQGRQTGGLEVAVVVFMFARWMLSSSVQSDVVIVVDVIWHDLAALGIILPVNGTTMGLGIIGQFEIHGGCE